MQRAELSFDETLLKQHYMDQPLFGSHGTTAPIGYTGTMKAGEFFHPNQAEYSRFTNNIGALSADERELLNSDVKKFWRRYYNSTSLGTVRAFEGPSPLANRGEHVARFIQALLNNEIGAHIIAGNPMSGLISKNTANELILGNRGFFDITAIPENYFDPKASWSVQQIDEAKKAYIARLENNSEIAALKKQGFTRENSLGRTLAQLADDFMLILAYLKQVGIQIYVTPIGGSEGAERYRIKISYNDKSQTIDYLALSQWDDFASQLFSMDKIAELASFYQANVQQTKIGVNCAAGLGRTGVIAMTFELLQRHDEFYNEQGIPNIANIDAMLQSMRTNRPGLVQTPDQYTLAIALARQIYVYLQPELRQQFFNTDAILAIYQRTQIAITDHQRAKIEKGQAQQANHLSSTAIIGRVIPVGVTGAENVLKRKKSCDDSAESNYVFDADDSSSQFASSSSVESIMQSMSDEVNLFGPSTSTEQIKRLI